MPHQALVRSAVSPLRRDVERVRAPLPRVDDVVRVEQPSEPLHALRPHTLTATAAAFVRTFPGEVLYAVKCNPDPRVLRALWQGGIRRFDCASLAEITLVRQMFTGAQVHFMHPVKSRPAIRDAFFGQGVTDFALDSEAELAKILTVTEGGGGALGLIVRLAMPKGLATYDLSGKFGAPFDQAVSLLRQARSRAARLGVCFHVGSQCLDPRAYGNAVRLVGRLVAEAAVPVEIVDVGGGFPVAYDDVTPPPLGAFFAEIEGALDDAGLADRVEVWAEPGRALVAAGGSVVVQVQLRRGADLYLNDGIYGSLADVRLPEFRFPLRLIPAGSRSPYGTSQPFRLFGPTCDSSDRMDGPFLLPGTVAEGDWIEVGQLGAYGAALRTAFNGFDKARIIEVADAPLIESGPVGLS
jgi:ornithine decarboxylase